MNLEGLAELQCAFLRVRVEIFEDPSITVWSPVLPYILLHQLCLRMECLRSLWHGVRSQDSESLMTLQEMQKTLLLRQSLCYWNLFSSLRTLLGLKHIQSTDCLGIIFRRQSPTSLISDLYYAHEKKRFCRDLTEHRDTVVDPSSMLKGVMLSICNTNWISSREE